MSQEVSRCSWIDKTTQHNTTQRAFVSFISKPFKIIFPTFYYIIVVEKILIGTMELFCEQKRTAARRREPQRERTPAQGESRREWGIYRERVELTRRRQRLPTI